MKKATLHRVALSEKENLRLFRRILEFVDNKNLTAVVIPAAWACLMGWTRTVAFRAFVKLACAPALTAATQAFLHLGGSSFRDSHRSVCLKLGKRD